VAQVAAYFRPFCQIDGLSATTFIVIIVLIIPQVDAVSGGAGKHGAFQVDAMAGAAGIGVSFVEILVFEVPFPAIDVMHAMGAIERKRQAGVTAAALADSAGMALQLNGRDVVIGGRQCVRPDGMGGAVATFTGHTAVSEAVAVERIGIFSEALVISQAGCSGIDIIRPGLRQADASRVAQSITGMTGLAAGLINPRLARTSAHGQHAAMTVDTLDTGSTHGAPEALGDLARVTLITGFLECAVSREQRCTC